jgi:ferritin-like metal-binding protein YciE
MKLDSLKKLYVHELKDLWSAEGQVLDVMPRVIEAVENDDLRKALKEHAEETRAQRGRIESIFETLDFEPGGHRCAGMAGLIEELSDSLGGDVDADVVDAALIAGLQRVEHYEIAGYGVARTFAEKLGDYEAADLLQKSLEEEAAADRRLSRLAERHINFEAMSASF